MSNHVPYYVTATVTAAGVLGGAYLAYRTLSQDKLTKLPETWEKVGVLKTISVFPIKSCAPILLNTVECTYIGCRDGWLRDRVLMVTDDKNNFITARGYPELLKVMPTIRNSVLTLKHANMETMHVNLAEGAFPDETSFHLVNEASVEDLNTRLAPDSQVTEHNFRPNFLLTGAKAYDEDKWKFLKIGEHIFEILKPCFRCALTTIDQETGVRSSKTEPLTELRKYRQALTDEERKLFGNQPRMGLLMALRSEPGGKISLNDPIYAA